MKERIFSRKFWQKVFNYQLIIWFLLMISYTFSQRNNHFYFIGDLFNLAFSTAIMGLNFYVQFKKDSSKTNTQIVRWLTIVILLNLAYHWEFLAKKPAGYRDSISITAMGGLYFLASSNCSCTCWTD